MNPFSDAFQGLFSLGFLKIILIYQNHRLIQIRGTNTNGEFIVPVDINDGVLCQYCEEPYLRCVRSFLLYNSYCPSFVTVQMYFPGDRKFLTWDLFLLFLMLKKAHGAGKTNKLRQAKLRLVRHCASSLS